MEVAKLVTFVKELIPLFFGIDVEWFNARIKEKYGSTPANEEADETTSATEDVSSKSRKTNGKKPDLLRTALDRGRSGKPSRKEKEDSVASDSRASTPGVASAVGEDADRAPVTPDEETQSGPTIKRWMEYADTENMYRGKSVSAKQPYKRNLYNLYGNLPIYCFFRMFIILYERLSQIKLAEGDVREAVRRANMPKPAIDLQINDKLPRNFWDDTSADANYYHQILKMLAEFSRGEMDFSHIEETLRRYYLHTGWRLYSYERLSQALVRFATAMLGTEAKDKSWELLQLFRKDRVREETTHHDEIVYRKQADKYLKEADTYKISYDKGSKHVLIGILKKNDPSTEPNDPLNAWRSYVAAYELEGHTEDIPALTYPNGTLLRNIPASLTADPTAAPDVADARSTAMDETLARLNGTLAVNQLEMRIWVENNRSTFLKERADTLLAPRAMAEGGKEGAAEREQLAEIRAAGIVERLVQNNGAMKGLSKEEVERKNEEWRVLVEDGVGVGFGVGAGAGGGGEQETGEE
ncbi:hypothetical protein LTR28_011367 [Elasticomyces elasticus]|nr:hypothetical protein LTR28_011367 [Elasticomyces elasticus]